MFDRNRDTLFGKLFLLALLALTSRATADEKDQTDLAAAMGRIIKPVNINQKSFGDTISYLRDSTGMNIFVNDRAIKAAGITPGDITLSDGNIKTADFLKAAVEQAGKGKMGIVQDQGIISITTVDAINAAATRPSYGKSSPPGPIDKKLAAALNKEITSLEFNNIPLVDAIEVFRETTSTNFDLDWTALKAVGVEKKTPITLQVRRASFSKLLSLLLDDAGNGKLDYRLENNLISIVPFGSKIPEDFVPGEQTPANKAVLALLDHTLPMSLTNVSLEESLQFFKEVSGAKVEIRWPVIKAAGIDVSSPINTQLQFVKFSQGLKIVLRQGGQGKLAYTVKDGAIVISTLEDLKASPATQPAK